MILIGIDPRTYMRLFSINLCACSVAGAMSARTRPLRSPHSESLASRVHPFRPGNRFMPNGRCLGVRMQTHPGPMPLLHEEWRLRSAASL